MGSLIDRIAMTAQDMFVGQHICPGPAKTFEVAFEALFRRLCQRLEGTGWWPCEAPPSRQLDLLPFGHMLKPGSCAAAEIVMTCPIGFDQLSQALMQLPENLALPGPVWIV